MKAEKTNPIGIFDSGIGGLTVANAIIRLLPNERLIYFGDTAHLPYGDKSAVHIRDYARRIVDFLLEKKSKIVVIACNSASSVAFGNLKKALGEKVLLLNVIDPVVEKVAADDRFKRVGVIGTKATIQSGTYKKKLRKLRPELVVKSLATPLLAPMIEEGFFNNNISQTIINSYLSKKNFREIEALIPACTHYPLILPEMVKYYQGKVEIIDTMDIVAHTVKEKLAKQDLLSPRQSGINHYYVSDFTESFEQTTRFFYKEKIHLEYMPIWD